MDPLALPRFDYQLDRDHRRIRITARDTLQHDDLVAIVDRQLHDGAWRFGVLYDLRMVTGKTARPDAVAVAEHVQHYVDMHGPRGPVALVTRSTGMVGAGQAYALDGEKLGFVVEVFWDIDEATAWLDTHQAK